MTSFTPLDIVLKNSESVILALESSEFADQVDASLLNDWYSRYTSLQRQSSTRWAQRAHMLWMNNGDQNTVFFHNNIRLLSHYNSISQISNSNGSFVTNNIDIDY